MATHDAAAETFRPTPIPRRGRRVERALRVLLYSPDSYGLGHIRRSLRLADRLLLDFPGSAARLVTGAPRAHYFRYPDGSDFMQIPAVTKDVQGRYVSQHPDRRLSETISTRSTMIRESAAIFRPDLLYVDHNPTGVHGELLPTLRRLGNGVRRVLGMRDIIDEPEAVARAWKRDRVLEVMRRDYDRLVVFGQRDVFDPIAAYDIPDDVAAKMDFVGYLERPGGSVGVREIHARFAPRTGKLVVVALGGGGDGNVLLRRFFRGLATLGDKPPFEVVAVTGPLMSPRRRDRFRGWASDLPGVTLLEYSPVLPDFYRAADFVVSMGGYNSICELACAGASALVVPRVFPRQEQLVRARLLADRGVLRYLTPDDATPGALISEVIDGLGRARPEPGWGLRFTGLDRTSEIISDLATEDRRWPEAR